MYSASTAATPYVGLECISLWHLHSHPLVAVGEQLPLVLGLTVRREGHGARLRVQPELGCLDVRLQCRQLALHLLVQPPLRLQLGSELLGARALCTGLLLPPDDLLASRVALRSEEVVLSSMLLGRRQLQQRILLAQLRQNQLAFRLDTALGRRLQQKSGISVQIHDREHPTCNRS